MSGSSRPWRYAIKVFEVFDDYEQLVETKYCRSLWLVTAFKRAQRNRYSGDDLSFFVMKVAIA